MTRLLYLGITIAIISDKYGIGLLAGKTWHSQGRIRRACMSIQISNGAISDRRMNFDLLSATVDDLVIDRVVQPLSDWLEMRISVNCHKLKRLCYFFALLALGSASVSGRPHVRQKGIAGLFSVKQYPQRTFLGNCCGLAPSVRRFLRTVCRLPNHSQIELRPPTGIGVPPSSASGAGGSGSYCFPGGHSVSSVLASPAAPSAAPSCFAPAAGSPGISDHSRYAPQSG